MPRLFDTHAHFTGSSGTIAAILDRAAAARVTHIMAVGGNAQLNSGALEAHALRPQQVRLALGYDREAALDPAACSHVDQLFASPPATLSALGEIGLDYHYHCDDAIQRAQRHLLEHQLATAARLQLPVIIHTRAADHDTLALLRNAAADPWFRGDRPGVIHCYTGDLHFAHALLELGYYLSFSGIVTFNAADALRQVAREIPLERLLIETDSPYLAPVPLRGHPNEPAYVIHVANCLARQRNLDPAALIRRTTANALHLFR